MDWGAGSIHGVKARRRSEHDITAEILSVARKGARPTRIMYKSNLSFKQRERYLSRLLGAGLLGITTKSPLVYTITRSGEEWLENYRKMKSIQVSLGFA